MGALSLTTSPSTAGRAGWAETLALLKVRTSKLRKPRGSEATAGAGVDTGHVLHVDFPVGKV